MVKLSLADLVKRAELSAYYDGSKLVVATIVRDAKTGRRNTREIDFPEYDVILHLYFKEPVDIKKFSYHAARYLRRKIPGCRRLTKEDDSRTTYRLEGRKGSDIRINTLTTIQGKGGVEFSICCNYVGAMDVLRNYALRELKLKRRDLEEATYLGNVLRKVR